MSTKVTAELLAAEVRSGIRSPPRTLKKLRRDDCPDNRSEARQAADSSPPWAASARGHSGRAPLLTNQTLLPQAFASFLVELVGLALEFAESFHCLAAFLGFSEPAVQRRQHVVVRGRA